MQIKSRRFQGVLVGLLAALAMPAAAQAACSTQPVSDPSTPFAQFADNALYGLAPGGGFEAGMADWTFSGGGAVVAGNESFSVRSASDQRSVRLPKKAMAVSPLFCVSLDHPTLRLFARQVTGSPGQLKVEIIYSGNKVKKAGLFANNGQYAVWAPSPVLPLADELPSNLMALGATDVQLRITADSGGTWEVDDVYIDPRAL